MLPEELTTERLLLRQWRDEDVEPLHAIYLQPGYLATMPAMTLDGTRKQVEWARGTWQSGGYCQWAACDRASGRLIGRIGLQSHADWPLADEPIPEVGWVLDQSWWGRGLATDGGQASVDVWRNHLPDEPRLYSFTLPRNRRSRAVMERLGFTRRGEAHWRGDDTVWYVLDR